MEIIVLLSDISYSNWKYFYSSISEWLFKNLQSPFFFYGWFFSLLYITLMTCFKGFVLFLGIVFRFGLECLGFLLLELRSFANLPFTLGDICTILHRILTRFFCFFMLRCTSSCSLVLYAVVECLRSWYLRSFGSRWCLADLLLEGALLLSIWQQL